MSAADCLQSLQQGSPSPNPAVLPPSPPSLSNVSPPVINVSRPRKIRSRSRFCTPQSTQARHPSTPPLLQPPTPLCILRHTALPPNVCTLHPAMFERPSLFALCSGAAAPASDEASGNYRSNLIEPQRRLPWMTPPRRGGQSDSFNADLFPVCPSFIFVFFPLFKELRKKLCFPHISFISVSCVRRAKQIFHLILCIFFFFKWGSLDLTIHFLGYSRWI